MASVKTAIIGNNDAIVTTPKPDRDESPLPADAAMPIPSDSTNGTVTGPVVTAPQSQARPRIVLRSGLLQTYIVRIIVGVSARYISGFNDQPLTNLTVPIIAANPTPAPTITTNVSLLLFNISYK